VDKALKEIAGLERQLPFVISSTLNSTAFIVRKHVIEVTYPKSFKVRNTVFARQVFRVTKLSTKRDLESAVGDGTERTFPFLERHARGGQKRPRNGGSLAIPVVPDNVRGARGAVKKALKPVNITERRKDTFLVTKGGRKAAIVQRKRGSKTSNVIYIFRNEAAIQPRFPFYEQTAAQFAFHVHREFARHLRRLTTHALFK
jgi:hypothetical protein